MTGVSYLRTTVFLFMIAALSGSCGLSGNKQLNRRVSLSRHDDIPYGARVAYDALPNIFPDAELVVSNNRNPFPLSESSTSKRALIVIATSVIADSADI